MTQKTLNQILDVLKYFRYNYQSGRGLTGSYQKAISRVSNEYGVTYQTIGDGCRRRLKLGSIDEFSELLKKWMKGEPESLIKVLKLQTSNRLHEDIDSFFQKFSIKNSSKLNGKQQVKNEENKVSISLELSKSDQRFLKAICEIEGKKEKEIIEDIVSVAIKNRMKQIVQKIN